MAIAQTLLGIAYPLLIILALQWFEARYVALLVLGLLGLRFALARVASIGSASRPQASASSRPPFDRESLANLVRAVWFPVVAVALVLIATAIWNDPIGLMLTPVFISLAFLASFFFSLSGQPMVERFARLQVGDLSPAEVAYCRSVTIVWCCFFVLNGGIALGLALLGELELWALFTGLVSYLLMGALFASEYVYRHYRFRRYVGGLADPLLMRLFPEWTLPERSSVTQDGLRRQLRWRIPHDLFCWPGHFPDDAILPGVLQIGFIVREVVTWTGRLPLPGRIEHLKFRDVVRPGDELEVDLERDPDGGRIDFRLSRAGQDIASGRLVAEADRESLEQTRSPSPSPSSSGPPPRPLGEPDWPEPAVVLAHSGPMVWLRAIEAHDASETRCRVDASGLEGFFGATGDPAGEGVPAWLAIEWMAQAVAAHDGLVRHARGVAPRIGLLLGSRCVSLHRSSYTPGASWRVIARRTWGGEQGLASFDCRVESPDTGESVVEARLSCYVPDGAGIDETARDRTRMKGEGS